jgi:hypothetical protein
VAVGADLGENHAHVLLERGCLRGQADDEADEDKEEAGVEGRGLHGSESGTLRAKAGFAKSKVR